MTTENALSTWEQEISTRHRWGTQPDAMQEELARLRALRDAATNWADVHDTLVEQIVAPEICNWRLGETIPALCEAIGREQPCAIETGHLATLTPERWRRVWAYYLALRDWLPHMGAAGFSALAPACDPDGAIRDHVLELLGERDEVKELLVERFCLCLEFWLSGFLKHGTPPMLAHQTAVAALEEAAAARGADPAIQRAMQGNGDGRLQPCHHKAFRRYDIILSSIGVNKWRGAMPQRGTDGFERADEVNALITPIEAWLNGAPHDALGDPTPEKRFLAALLASITRSQTAAARRRADKRATR